MINIDWTCGRFSGGGGGGAGGVLEKRPKKVSGYIIDL